MKTIIFLSSAAILLSGCQNLKHATNVNFADLKNLRHNDELMEKLDERVKIIDSKKAKDCALIKKIAATDNVLDQGEKYAVYYGKHKAMKMDGNAMVIDKKFKVGDYGHKIRARVFRCPDL